ncbi:MAG: ribulose-phosphate 3-epimerase [Actinomycetota bacterium]
MPWSEWVRTVEVEPSLYAADFGHLADQIEVLLHAGARIFHFDCGDGRFVEPITMGPIVLASISERIHAMDGKIDCHLMVENPSKHFGAFARAGADSVTFHYEAVRDVRGCVQAAREHELEVGLAFKPGTPVEEAVAAAEGVDLVLCMSIEPGYSGQQFLPGSLDRIKRTRELLPPEVHVQVDGGIDEEIIRIAHVAGATLLVSASAIFGREDLSRAYRRLVQALA